MGGIFFDDALPMKQVLSLCFIQLCDLINGGAIYPYIIFLVQSFSLTDDERKLGYYAGLLAASYFFAQLLSSLWWGIASDKFGRRPCLLLGLFFSIVNVVLFGFSNSLPYAIVTRFLSGFLNGNIGITKTMLGEISTTETQARAFSYFGLTVAVSGIVGPLVGGVLSKPSEKYPSVFGGVSLFQKYPYCLPNLIVASLSTVGLIIGIFLLPETKKWGESEQPLGREFFAKLLAKLPFSSKSQKFTKLQEMNTFSATLGDDDPLEPVGADKVDETGERVEKSKPPPRLSVLGNISFLGRDRGVALACTLYAILGLMFVFYEEMTPYWSFLEIEYGGLGFSSTDIGIVTSIGCVIGMLFQMFIYPRIANKVGVLKAFRIGGILTLPGLMLMPQVSIISLALTSNRHLDKNPLTWALLSLAILFIQVGGELLFISVMIAISNSAVPEMMGTVNGIAQSFVALTRTMAPVIGSSLLSWSLTNGLPFPFNYQFPFIVLTLIGASLIGLSLFAPPGLNMQKKEALRKEEAKLLSAEST